MANKAFGFPPQMTLWGMSYQTLNAMFIEHYYMNKRQFDDKGEYEWIEMPTVDGKMKRVKKYKDPSKVM